MELKTYKNLQGSLQSLYIESSREELDYDEDNIEKNEWKSQELASMDESYYLSFKTVSSFS